MKKTTTKPDQVALLKRAREQLGMTNAQFAAALGISEDGLLAWLAPPHAKKRRPMPDSARLLLAAILAQHRAKK